MMHPFSVLLILILILVTLFPVLILSQEVDHPTPEEVLDSNALSMEGNQQKVKKLVENQTHGALYHPKHSPDVTASYEKAQYSASVLHEHDIMILSCPSGKMINIEYASYGTPKGLSADGYYFEYGACHSKFSSDILRDHCDYQNSCNITAMNKLFTDPCPGTRKWLTTVYNCGLAKVSQTHEVSISEGTSITMDCGDDGIKMQWASYGTPLDYNSKGECDATTTETLLSRACNHRAACSVHASSQVFGDPCPKNTKKLMMSYVCVHWDWWS